MAESLHMYSCRTASHSDTGDHTLRDLGKQGVYISLWPDWEVTIEALPISVQSIPRNPPDPWECLYI